MLKSITGFLVDFCSAGLHWFYVVWKADTFLEWHLLLVTFIISVFFLGSGFLAATIAEYKGHQMKFHFLFGVLAPYIYPFILFGNMKKQKKIEYAEAEAETQHSTQSYILTAKLFKTTMEQEAEKQAKVDAINAKRGIIKQEKEEIPSADESNVVNDVQTEKSEEQPIIPEIKPETEKFNRSYFEKQSVDESGNRIGPFAITLKDRSSLVAEKIKIVQDDLAIFEMTGKNGELKNIRIKFANIESCEIIQQSGNK